MRGNEKSRKFSHGGHRWGVSEKKFREVYKKSRGDGTEIMELTGLARKTVINRLYRYGLPFNNLSTYFPSKNSSSINEFDDDFYI